MTKAQYEFLKSVKTIIEQKSGSSKALKIVELKKLLAENPMLYPSDPLSEHGVEDEQFTEGMSRHLIEDYLSKCGLNDCFVYDDGSGYRLTSNGLEKMSNYQMDIRSKIRIPYVSLGISLLSIIIAIIALIIKS